MEKDFFIIEDFSCGYVQFKLDLINIKLPKGTFAGIIGPNGSGKTTLFKGISRLLPAIGGSIKLNGQDLSRLNSKERARKIAVVSQFTDDNNIPVKDYVLMGRIPYQKQFQFFESDADIEIAEKYMKLTGVFEYRNKPLNELSGGEKQRSSIARALCQEPDLLLLDEPTSHLDISNQVKILDLIHRLNKEMELTVLMVIHDLNLASEYCDELFLLNEGKIFNNGTPEDVLNFQNIEKVYNTPVVTRTNPYSGKPVVFLLSEKVLKKEG